MTDGAGSDVAASTGARRLGGEVRVVADPPAAYAALVVELVGAAGAAGGTAAAGGAAGPGTVAGAGGAAGPSAAAGLGAAGGADDGEPALDEAPFCLAVSGGASGEACMRALVDAGLDWGRVAVFFADERCVPEDDPRSNAGSLRGLLGSHLDELAAWLPMSCEQGPASYDAALRRYGGLDLVQLGFGPDGHTASLFPGSPALDAEPGALVALNEDPTGRNPLQRMTLTLPAIGQARTVVIVVSGAEKHDVLERLLDGEDLPAGRVHARERLVWLIDEAAAGGLGDRLAPR